MLFITVFQFINIEHKVNRFQKMHVARVIVCHVFFKCVSRFLSLCFSKGDQNRCLVHNRLNNFAKCAREKI